nr:TIM44-like domain-containing protein [uncultured Desulfuromonas sp.]
MVKTRSIVLLLAVGAIAVAMLCCAPDSALARAGGGGGKGGGSWLNVILWPVILIYSTILARKVRKKNQESQALLEKLAAHDAAWQIDAIKARIEEAFFKIQHAWMERNQDLAKEYMSERLYRKHKTQTDQMIRDNRKNVLENINLETARIVEVADSKDDSKDHIWVYLEGTMNGLKNYGNLSQMHKAVGCWIKLTNLLKSAT